MIERDILERIKLAKIRLRFDKVALRLVDNLRKALADEVRDCQALIVTVTAPIKLPVKTAAALESLIRDTPPGSGRRAVVCGNRCSVRWMIDVPPRRPKLLGFVHDPAADAELILSLAAARLVEAARPTRE